MTVSAADIAATALAGLTAEAYVPAPDEHVVVLVCGANADPPR